MYVVILTESEKRIYDLKQEGKSLQEISEILNLSKNYVAKISSNINSKLKVVPEGKKYKIEVSKKQTKQKSKEELSEKLSEKFFNDQINYWKKKYEQLKKLGSFEERLLSLFQTAINKFPELSFEVNYDYPDYADEELVLLLSDIHAGEEISSEETLGLNEYNIEVMKKRLEQLTYHIIDITKKMNIDNKKLNIWMLGDMVSGIIHEELLQGTTIVDEILILAESLSKMIYELLNVFPKIEIACVVGNHGRMKKKPYYKNKYNNFDYLVYKYLEIKFENIDRVKFIIPKSSMLMIQKFNYNFLLMHGDSKVRSYAGIPFYGIRRADSQITQLLTATKDTYPNYIVMGHFHTSNVLEKIGGKIIMNGCLSGTNEHSMGTIFTGTEPKQTMFSINEKFGVNWLLDVFVE